MLNPPFLATGKKTITLYRQSEGSYVDGRWEDGDSTSVTITANVQPGLKYNDTQMLAEGERSRKSLRVYTQYELRGVKEGTSGNDCDYFVWEDGETYEVRYVTDYKMGVLNHYKGICIRRERT